MALLSIPRDLALPPRRDWVGVDWRVESLSGDSLFVREMIRLCFFCHGEKCCYDRRSLRPRGFASTRVCYCGDAILSFDVDALIFSFRTTRGTNL